MDHARPGPFDLRDSGPYRCRPDPLPEVARARLSALLSQSCDYTFHHKLRPGEGYVSNSMLRNRAGFTDPTGAVRLLLRTRYLDPISVLPHPANV